MKKIIALGLSLLWIEVSLGGIIPGDDEEGRPLTFSIPISRRKPEPKPFPVDSHGRMFPLVTHKPPVFLTSDYSDWAEALILSCGACVILAILRKE